MKLPILACLATLCALPAAAQQELGYRGQKSGKGATGYAGYNQALAGLRAKSSMTERQEKGWIVFMSRDRIESWSFTSPGHYAHPSYARRKAVQKGADWSVKTDMQCGATKPVCDRLMREYLDLDKRMKEYFDARHGKSAG
jgi:hypothetical protein